MKLSEYARKQGINYQTCWRHAKAGKIEGAYKTSSGAYFVDEELALKNRLMLYNNEREQNTLKLFLLQYNAEWQKFNKL